MRVIAEIRDAASAARTTDFFRRMALLPWVRLLHRWSSKKTDERVTLVTSPPVLRVAQFCPFHHRIKRRWAQRCPGERRSHLEALESASEADAGTALRHRRFPTAPAWRCPHAQCCGSAP